MTCTSTGVKVGTSTGDPSNGCGGHGRSQHWTDGWSQSQQGLSHDRASPPSSVLGSQGVNMILWQKLSARRLSVVIVLLSFQAFPSRRSGSEPPSLGSTVSRHHDQLLGVGVGNAGPEQRPQLNYPCTVTCSHGLALAGKIRPDHREHGMVLGPQNLFLFIQSMLVRSQE